MLRLLTEYVDFRWKEEVSLLSHPYPVGLSSHVAGRRRRIAVHRWRPRRGTVVVAPVPVGGLELALQLPDGAVLVLALLLKEDDLPLEVAHLVEAGGVLPGELQLFGQTLQEQGI